MVMKEITNHQKSNTFMALAVRDVAPVATCLSFPFRGARWGIASSGNAAAFSVVSLLAGRRGGISVIWV